MKSNRLKKAFQAKSSVRTGWILLAIAGVLVTGAGFAIDRPIPAGGLALVLGTMMAIWTSRASIVRVYDKHFELKAAPLAALRKVRYSDIDSVEITKKKIGEVTLKGRKRKPVKIPLKMLEADEGKRLMRYLSAKAAA